MLRCRPRQNLTPWLVEVRRNALLPPRPSTVHSCPLSNTYGATWLLFLYTKQPVTYHLGIWENTVTDTLYCAILVQGANH
jgi:hypothetical protein